MAKRDFFSPLSKTSIPFKIFIFDQTARKTPFNHRKVVKFPPLVYNISTFLIVLLAFFFGFIKHGRKSREGRSVLATTAMLQDEIAKVFQGLVTEWARGICDGKLAFHHEMILNVHRRVRRLPKRSIQLVISRHGRARNTKKAIYLDLDDCQ